MSLSLLNSITDQPLTDEERLLYTKLEGIIRESLSKIDKTPVLIGGIVEMRIRAIMGNLNNFLGKNPDIDKDMLESLYEKLGKPEGKSIVTELDFSQITENIIVGGEQKGFTNPALK